jgi:Ca2+-binding RTX toxin-like protein
MTRLMAAAASDWASYGSATGAVTVDLGAGSSSGDAGNDSLISVENVLGGAGNDYLGDSLNNTLNGGLGNDTLDGGGGDDWASYGSATARSLLTLRGQQFRRCGQ